MICILVRDFATTQEKRLNPTLSDAPLILYEAGKYRPKVIAPDATARRDGVKAGDWLGAAKSLSPLAQLLPLDEARYRRIFTDITLNLLQITDRIEPEYQPTSAVWYTDDSLMLSHLLEAVTEQTGITPQVGIANTKFTARVAAAVSSVGETVQVAADASAEFLAPYSVTLLPLDKKMQRRLPLLGLDTLGQLAQLPRIAVWEQFGKHGRWLHDLANGVDVRPLTPFKPPEILCVSHTFEEAIADRQTLQRVLEKLSLQLAEGLNGRESHHLTLLLQTENDGLLEYSRHLHDAARDGLYLLRLLTQMLDALPVTSSVTALDVRLGDIREKVPVQLALFDEKPPIARLHEQIPQWASRYRSSAFYRLSLTGENHLRERELERQKVSAG